MASSVDICNLALGHLGDSATVASIDPPEGSAQAQHCARFYPIAVNSLLEMASWSFATKRAYLAEVENAWPMWVYAYAAPSDMVNAISVLPKDAMDDYSETLVPAFDQPWPQGYCPPPVSAIYTPQPFAMEVNSAGQQVILTNVPTAVLRYTSLVQDTAKFTPLFTAALAWYLASMIAGPLLKGDVGAAESKRCLQMFQAVEAMAESSDANQRNIKPQIATPWIVNR